jgi:hypothetical protein
MSEVSMEDLNRSLIDQVYAQITSGLVASRASADYCVVRAPVRGVLTVVLSTSAGNEHERVFGPDTFAACMAHVNRRMAARPRGTETTGDPRAGARGAEFIINEDDTP